MAPTLLLHSSWSVRLLLAAAPDSAPLYLGAALSASERTAQLPTRAYTRVQSSPPDRIGHTFERVKLGMTVERGMRGGCFTSQALRAL